MPARVAATRRSVALFGLATLVGVLALARLGVWQLDQAEHKRGQMDAYTSDRAKPIAATRVRGAEDELYAPTTARGSYDGARQFLIDNTVRQGRNGYFVVTPFRLHASGKFLLVNRGWVAQDPARSRLPRLDDIDATERTIGGRVGRLPVAGLELDTPPPAPGWPSVRQFPDFAELERGLGEPVLRWVLLLDPVDAHGFLRVWEPGGLSPERHLGYAFQWFALAATLLVIFVVMSMKRVSRDE